MSRIEQAAKELAMVFLNMPTDQAVRYLRICGIVLDVDRYEMKFSRNDKYEWLKVYFGNIITLQMAAEMWVGIQEDSFENEGNAWDGPPQFLMNLFLAFLKTGERIPVRVSAEYPDGEMQLRCLDGVVSSPLRHEDGIIHCTFNRNGPRVSCFSNRRLSEKSCPLEVTRLSVCRDYFEFANFGLGMCHRVNWDEN